MADGTRPATRGPGCRRGTAAALLACLLLTALAGVPPAFTPPALAQGFSWPWSEPEKKPEPKPAPKGKPRFEAAEDAPPTKFRGGQALDDEMPEMFEKK